MPDGNCFANQFGSGLLQDLETGYVPTEQEDMKLGEYLISYAD